MRKTIIEPNGRNLQYWKDIWNYRELAFNLAKRDVTVRYKQTRIGIGWAIIAPIISMIVNTFIFGNLAGLSSDGDAPYFLMVFAGTIPWTLFSKAVNTDSSTFITNANLMKKVYFPRIMAPIGSAFASLFDCMISMGVMIILMLITGYYPTWKFVLFPVFLVLILILGMFLGLALAAFNIKWRDLAQIVPFAISIGQYLTPVAYSIDSIPEKLRVLYSLNPATGFINAFKWTMLKTMDFDWLSFIIAIVWLIILIPLGLHLFRKSERTFVDIV